MRMRISLLVFMMCAVAVSTVSAAKVSFSVVDSVGEPEVYATVRIYQLPDTAKAVVLDVTDEHGKFSTKLSSAGDYSLTVSSVGKAALKRKFSIKDIDESYNLGKLVLSNSAAMLGEVEVVAMRPVVKTEIDRLVYDIQADEESKTNTIFEMLRKVPLVSVDGQDNVTVNGSSNFKIYKNGRPNSSWSRNPKDVLKSIPASMIQRIEVITEPGAKYEAEGVNGILNIVMLDNTIVKGAAGSVSASANSRGIIGAYAFVMAQMGKFTTTVNYGRSDMVDDEQSEQLFGSETEYINSGSVRKVSGVSKSKWNFQHVDIEASLEIDTLNLITMSFGGFMHDGKPLSSQHTSMSDAAGNLIYSFDQNSAFNKNGYFDFNGKLDYQHTTRRKGESLVFSYLLSTTRQTNDSWLTYENGVNMPVGYTRRDTYDHLDFSEHTFQLDYTRPFGKGHKLELGGKYILRINDSETEYTYSDPTLDTYTDFKHTTQVGALYAEYAYNSAKWGARAGVRYEYAHLSAKYPNGAGVPFKSDIGDVVPTLSLNYKFDERNSLKFNFATRINRPGISYLNPAVNSSPETVQYGNPDLESARRNSLNLSYSLMTPKFTTVLGIGGGWSNNQVTSYLTVKPDGEGRDVVYSTYGNIGRGRDASFSAYVQWRCTPKTTFMLNGNIRYRYMDNKNLDLKNDGVGYSVYARVEQQIPWDTRVSLQGGSYRSGARGLYDTSGGNYWYNVSINKSFLKEKRLTVYLFASQPIGKKYNTWRSSVNNGGYRQDSYSQSRNRSFGVNISYRFGSFNAQVKKTAKTIDNDDLEGRK